MSEEKPHRKKNIIVFSVCFLMLSIFFVFLLMRENIDHDEVKVIPSDSCKGLKGKEYMDCLCTLGDDVKPHGFCGEGKFFMHNGKRVE